MIILWVADACLQIRAVSRLVYKMPARESSKIYTSKVYVEGNVNKLINHLSFVCLSQWHRRFIFRNIGQRRHRSTG